MGRTDRLLVRLRSGYRSDDDTMDRAPLDPLEDFPTPEQERQEDRQDTMDSVTMFAATLLLVGMAVTTVVWMILVASQWIKRWLVV